jgi:hypothetical protein
MRQENFPFVAEDEKTSAFSFFFRCHFVPRNLLSILSEGGNEFVELCKRKLGKQAQEFGFTRDTLEKVCRLAEILKHLNTDSLLEKALALKGGTAINLTIFNLSRL